MHFVADDSILPRRLAHILSGGINNVVPDRRRPHSVVKQLGEWLLLNCHYSSRLVDRLHRQFGKPRWMDKVVNYERRVIPTTKDR